MALIKCQDCGGDVSTRATSCPHCGAPIHAETAHPAPRNPTTIERTGKPYKLATLIAVLLIVASIFALIGGADGSAAVMFCIGALLFVFARIGAWWANG